MMILANKHPGGRIQEVTTELIRRCERIFEAHNRTILILEPSKPISKWKAFILFILIVGLVPFLAKADSPEGARQRFQSAGQNQRLWRMDCGPHGSIRLDPKVPCNWSSKLVTYTRCQYCMACRPHCWADEEAPLHDFKTSQRRCGMAADINITAGMDVTNYTVLCCQSLRLTCQVLATLRWQPSWKELERLRRI